MSGAGEGTEGFLAGLQLLGSAAADRRVTGFQLRTLNSLAGFAGYDGTCCVSIPTIAARMGVTRTPVQRALQALARLGYVSIEQRLRKTGAKGANVYGLNLELRGAVACPVPWPKGTPPLEGAWARPRQKGRGTPPPEGAYNKPPEQTTKEQTIAVGHSIGERRSRGKAASCLQGEASRRQRPLLLPINGDGAPAPGAAVLQRVQAFNQQAERTASGRLWSAWAKVDPDLQLYDGLRASGEQVARKAQDIEAQRPGHGVRYLAGAAAKASGGRWTAAEILAGAAARRAAQ